MSGGLGITLCYLFCIGLIILFSLMVYKENKNKTK